MSARRVSIPIQRWVGREARQRTANPCTRVQIPYPPRHDAPTEQHHPRAIGAAVARFPDTEEVTGSNPVSPTSRRLRNLAESGAFSSFSSQRLARPQHRVLVLRDGFTVAPRRVKRARGGMHLRAHDPRLTHSHAEPGVHSSSRRPAARDRPRAGTEKAPARTGPHPGREGSGRAKNPGRLAMSRPTTLRRIRSPVRVRSPGGRQPSLRRPLPRRPPRAGRADPSRLGRPVREAPGHGALPGAADHVAATRRTVVGPRRDDPARGRRRPELAPGSPATARRCRSPDAALDDRQMNDRHGDWRKRRSRRTIGA